MRTTGGYFANNYAYLEYRIEPKLGREQLSVLDCQEGERPYLKAKSPDSRFLPKASSCSVIAIIGGSRGRGNSDDGPQYAASSLYFEPQKEIEWRLSFQTRRSGKTRNRLNCYIFISTHLK